ALRHMKQAEKFNRPIICFIDKKGAYPGKAAEERGQSEAIARNLMEISDITVQIICIEIGEGGSGGALALGVVDHLHLLENSTYSIITISVAAALIWKDSNSEHYAAEAMSITAHDLKEIGIVDEIIPEPIVGEDRDLNERVKHID